MECSISNPEEAQLDRPPRFEKYGYVITRALSTDLHTNVACTAFNLSPVSKKTSTIFRCRGSDQPATGSSRTAEQVRTIEFQEEPPGFIMGRFQGWSSS